MPICYHCKEYTSQEEETAEKEVLCAHCGRLIMSEGRLILSEEESLPEEISGKTPLVFPLLLCLSCFASGVFLSQYYQNSQQLPPISYEEPARSVNFLLQEHLNFGDFPKDILKEYPNLFALSAAENHFVLYEDDLIIPLSQPVDVQNIFYFFGEDEGLHSIEYLISAENTDLDEVIAQISQDYRLFESTEEYLLWEGADGYLGLHRDYYFLHISPDRQLLLSVFR